MTLKDQKQISKPVTVSSKIRMNDLPDSGEVHPLWSMLDSISPAMPWRRLPGAVRGGVCRIAEMMHERNIPYGMYVDWLTKFGKGYLKRRPLSLVGHKVKADGSPPIFLEFLMFTDRLQQVYTTCPGALRVNDAAYKLYPGSYAHGYNKFLYSVDLLVEALKTRTSEWLMVAMTKKQTIEEFWHLVGDPLTPKTPQVIDLSEGRQNKQAVKILSDELRVRTGVAPGFANPNLNHYFKSGGKLNSQGLKVITGECPIKERNV